MTDTHDSGSSRIEPIKALPGQNRYTADMTDRKIERLLEAGRELRVTGE